MKMPHDPDRGKRIKDLRDGLGLTQEALADELGLPKHGYRSIQQWEAGDGISYPNLRKLVEYFGVDLSYVMRGIPTGQADRDEQLDRIERTTKDVLRRLAVVEERLPTVEALAAAVESVPATDAQEDEELQALQPGLQAEQPTPQEPARPQTPPAKSRRRNARSR